MTTFDQGPAAADLRATEALADAEAPVSATWAQLRELTEGHAPPMGLTAGARPAADVEVLAGAVAMAEFELGRRMHAATQAGSLPLVGHGAALLARGWGGPWARRLARCAALTADHPLLAAPWAAGVITSDHVDALARHAGEFTGEELTAVIAELGPQWGSWSPAVVERFVRAAARLLHPPQDPSPEEAGAYETRTLSFAVTGDSVVLTGELPRIEGELVIAAIDAFAERLRSTADHVAAGARRADALVELVNAAHACDALPTRGGLPVSLTVTLDHTSLGDPLWRTDRGHTLTDAEARWASCDAAVTPIVAARPGCSGEAPLPDQRPDRPDAAARIAALAAAMLGPREPLSVGRTQRTASTAQRRALAVRDGGCIIPGCGVPAGACQTHHLVEWCAGGNTDLSNLTLLCWAHHRQVDLGMWTVERADPHPPGAVDPALPHPGTRAGSGWPANHAAPFTIVRTPRSTWRT